jgi:AcrB/AcrD/AcrF family protein
VSKFFIDRPIFAIVIALLTMLAGGLSILRMPIEQYPTIAPPSIQVTATYPGASAQTVENTVVQVIEQQMNGLNNLLYLASTSDDSGTATTTLTFSPGTNPDIAQVQVQNKPTESQDVRRRCVACHQHSRRRSADGRADAICRRARAVRRGGAFHRLRARAGGEVSRCEPAIAWSLSIGEDRDSRSRCGSANRSPDPLLHDL